MPFNLERSVRRLLSHSCLNIGSISDSIHRIWSSLVLIIDLSNVKSFEDSSSWKFGFCRNSLGVISEEEKEARNTKRDVARDMATFPVFWYSSRRSAAKSRAYNGPRSTVYCPCTRFQAYPRIGEGVGARTEMERSRIKRDTALNHPPAEWKLTFNPRVHDSARMQTTCPRLLYHLCLSQFRSSRRISSFRDCTFIFPFLFFLMRLSSPINREIYSIPSNLILFFEVNLAWNEWISCIKYVKFELVRNLFGNR